MVALFSRLPLQLKMLRGSASYLFFGKGINIEA